MLFGVEITDAAVTIFPLSLSPGFSWKSAEKWEIKNIVAPDYIWCWFSRNLPHTHLHVADPSSTIPRLNYFILCQTRLKLSEILWRNIHLLLVFLASYFLHHNRSERLVFYHRYVAGIRNKERDLNSYLQSLEDHLTSSLPYRFDQDDEPAVQSSLKCLHSAIIRPSFLLIIYH